MSSIFIYGRPGSGKTTLAASMTKLGYKVLFIDVDCKVEEMHNLKQPLEQGLIEIWPVEQKLMESSLKTKMLQPAIALLKQPKGYLQFCDYISKLEEIKECPWQVLVVDSLTSLVEHEKRLIGHLAKKDKFSFDEWGVLLANLEELFYTLLSLRKLFEHVIVIAHEMIEKDEDTGRIVSILPAIEGSMRNKISKYFTEVYRLEVKESKTGVSYLAHTKPLNKAEARTSRQLEAISEADFSVMYKEAKSGEAKTKP